MVGLSSKNLTSEIFSMMHYWNFELLIVVRQMSSAFLPQLYNNGSSAQEGLQAHTRVYLFFFFIGMSSNHP